MKERRIAPPIRLYNDRRRPDPGKHLPDGRWTQVQKGMPLREQQMLDQLAHGLVTLEAIDWICDLIVFRNYAGDPQT
jgi:hypothetical protein